jgi:glycosyltransferase involved in cell wall biosynthesis
MKKLRIAVWHNLPSGGAKRALWDHVSGLIRLGHQVESWCPETADKNYLSLSQLCQEHRLPLAASPMPSAPKFFGWVALDRHVRSRIAAMRAHCAAAAVEINQGNFDVVLVNSCLDMLASPLARFLQAPKVLYLQEPNRRFYEALEESPWAAPAGDPGLARLSVNSLRGQHRRLLMREELDNARHYDRILANSFYSRESILRAYGLDSDVCYLGIDTDFFRPTNEPVEKYVIGLGSLIRHKGAQLAIQALGLIPAAQRPKLLWIGNYTGDITAAELAASAKNAGVELEVKIMVKDAELISCLSRATAMIYSSRLEPFGLAPLEANACGTPVIAIAEGGVRETIVPGENGILVSNARPPTLAAAVQRLIADPALAAQLRSRCREVVLARWQTSAAAARLEAALCDTLAAVADAKAK